MTEPAELQHKAQKVRKALAGGTISPALVPYVVSELLSEVDCRGSDYKEFLLLASECFVRRQQPRRAALTMALAQGADAALRILPSDQHPIERAYLLSYKAKTLPDGAGGALELLTEAAELCQAAGRFVSAALFWQQTGKLLFAKEAWNRLLGGQLPPYERALVHTQLALLGGPSDGRVDPSLRASLWAEGQRHASLGGQLLEEVADEHESAGRRAQALDCYRVLAQLGQQRGSVENLAEGYLGMLRIVRGERLVEAAMRCYDEFLAHAERFGEHELCAEQCKEAAQFLARCGHRQRAIRYEERAARALMLVASGRLQAGAVRLAEHALLSAAELLSSGSSPTLLRDVLTQLAALVPDPIQRARYQRLAQAVPVPSRLPVAQAVSPSGPTVGPVAEPVWSWDLLAWESAASPTAVCLRLLLDPSRPELTRRHALLALLYVEESDTDSLSIELRQRLGKSLGSLRAYDAVAPLVRLYRESLVRPDSLDEQSLRAQIVDAMPRLPFSSSLALVVSALSDPADAVRLQARGALSRLGTAELLSTLGQLFAESHELPVQLALLSALSKVADPRAVERLLQVFVSQPDPLRREARRGLLALRDGSLRPLYARALLTVPPDREPDLRVLIAELFPSGL